MEGIAAWRDASAWRAWSQPQKLVHLVMGKSWKLEHRNHNFEKGVTKTAEVVDAGGLVSGARMPQMCCRGSAHRPTAVSPAVQRPSCAHSRARGNVAL